MRWAVMFSAGHRIDLPGHACRFLHGHDYVASIDVRGDSPAVMVETLDHRVGRWIANNWDGGFLIARTDGDAYFALSRFGQPGENQRVAFLDEPPTAEAITRFLERVVAECLQGTAIQVENVTVTIAREAIPIH